ncbi:MAG: hypothetical protein ACE5KY_00040 [Candidatus Tectimicrobiota bacterium]
MKYLVTAKLRPGQAGPLREALETGGLAVGEVYEAEMQRALAEAVVDGVEVRWIETCYCTPPLKAERSVLEVYFAEIETEPLVGEPPMDGVPLPDHLRSASAA